MAKKTSIGGWAYIWGGYSEAPIPLEDVLKRISELGFDWRLGKSFFVLGRLPGIMAHVQEEITNEKPYRRIDDEDVEYTGHDLNQ